MRLDGKTISTRKSFGQHLKIGIENHWENLRFVSFLWMIGGCKCVSQTKVVFIGIESDKSQAH